MTHPIEVAQVARTIAGTPGLNQELTEAVALTHDPATRPSATPARMRSRC